jgi:hypothetical protein
MSALDTARELTAKESAYIAGLRAKNEAQKFLGYHDALFLLKCVDKLLSDMQMIRQEAMVELDAIRTAALKELTERLA